MGGEKGGEKGHDYSFYVTKVAEAIRESQERERVRILDKSSPRVDGNSNRKE